jgi:hypothetical protein
MSFVPPQNEISDAEEPLIELTATLIEKLNSKVSNTN